MHDDDLSMAFRTTSFSVSYGAGGGVGGGERERERERKVIFGRTETNSTFPVAE